MLIDVSNHQGVINWNQTGPAIDGAYIKVTEGTSFVDARWRTNHDQASGMSEPVGAYHFADLGDPVKEANHFADVYIQAAWQLRPVLDIETAGATATWVRAFRTQFRARTGATPFRVYSSLGLLLGALNPVGWIDTDTDIWVAAYRSVLGWNHPRLVLWQNTSTANVPGVVGNVDADQYQNGWTPTRDTTNGADMTPDESNRLKWLEQAVRTLINQVTGDPKGDPSFDSNGNWVDGHLPGFPNGDRSHNFTLAEFARQADWNSYQARGDAENILAVLAKLSTGAVDVSALAVALQATLAPEIVRALGLKLTQ